MAERAVVRTAAGQEFRVTTPGRVFYRETETTKADVINYYLQVADVMLPHLRGRPATRKRWPDGTTGPEFFAKDLELGTPAWLTRVQIRHHSGPKFYPIIDTPAGLGWLGQVAALELHVPQWRIEPAGGPSAASTTSSTRFPDRVVFDLDPGPGAGLAECVEVALYLRERLGPLGRRLVPVTSGSKGLHIYVPIGGSINSEQASDWARLVAEQIEQAMPTLVVSKMAKALRPGKVLIDWSQNHPKKTTIAPYSLRGRSLPTVAAPRTWDELTEPGLAHLDYREVLDRVAVGLDPLANLLTTDDDELLAAAGNPTPISRRPAASAGRRPVPTRPVPPPADAPQTRRGRRPVREVLDSLPAGLAGPVDVALARAEDRVPGTLRADHDLQRDAGRDLSAGHESVHPLCPSHIPVVPETDGPT